MPKKFHLGSHFETDGVFWPGGNPQANFSAHLNASRKGIEISAAATIGGPSEFFADPKPKPAPEVLHGWTTLGDCTLFDLHPFVGPQQLRGTTGETLSVDRFRVGLCIMGVHLADPAEPLVGCSIECTYSGLASWLRPTSEVSITDDAVSLKYPRKGLPIVDFSVRSKKTHIVLSVGSDVELSSSGRHMAAHRPRVKFEPVEPASLDELFDVATRFENFLSLFLGVSVRLQTVELKLSKENAPVGRLVRRQRRKVEKHDPQASFVCDNSRLAAAIAKWFSEPQELRPLENLIYGTLRDSSMFVETEFLSLAQALESFHRLTDSTPGVERTFRNRIEALLARLKPEHAQRLLDNPQEFEQTLRETRNFFTHLGIHAQPKVLRSTRDLFLMNQKLHALLRLLMLINVGFPEDVVFNAIRYQSQKWTLF